MTDVDAELTRILRAADSSLSSQSVRSALAATNKEMREDSRAHGGSGEEPFWDMLSDERTHVFSVFEFDTLELYVLSSPYFQELINKLHFLSMADVAELKKLLVTDYAMANPNISISRSHAEHWLGG